MASNFIIRFFKYLFSALKKDATLQHREERIEKKEKRSILEDSAKRLKCHKENKKIKERGLILINQCSKIIPFVKSFMQAISSHLKDPKNNPFDTQKNYNYILEQFGTIKKNIKESNKLLEKFVENIWENVDEHSDVKKVFKEENKILKKEYKNLVRSSKKKKNFDQADKEAIIKKKIEISSKQLFLLNKSKSIYKGILNPNKSNLKKTKNLLKNADNIDKKINQKKNSWSTFNKTIESIESFFERVNFFYMGFNYIVEKSSQLLASAEEVEKENYHLIKEKEKLDKLYDSYLISEEISQQKGEEEVPEAA